MPDITMCKNEKCTKKNSCHRFLAKPSVFQSYAHFVQDEDGNCHFFWQADLETIQSFNNRKQQEEE